ncbi:MAG: sel1 repeat family protein, partial [Victivallales bacterium]|nr:sel1 repeat family protein [Victivallales bacterium]
MRCFFISVIILSCLLCQCLANQTVASQGVRIAVLDFENLTGKGEYAHYAKGLRDVLQSDIQLEEGCEYVERGRLNEIIKEIELSNKRGLFAPETAVKAGRLAAATHVIFGSYFCHEEQWKLNIRFVHVESGIVLASFGEQCTKDNLLARIDALARTMQDNLSPSLARFRQRGEHEPMSSLTSGHRGENRPSNEYSFAMFDEYSRAMSKYENGDRDALKAFVDKCRRTAEQGDADAQFYLGKCFYNAQGAGKDYVEAARWWRKAAEQGHAKAQYNLGVCYYNGEGVEKDYEEAARWWRKAAEQGLAVAQYNLGNCHYYGKGMEKDYKEAVRWWSKAAEQGHARA